MWRTSNDFWDNWPALKNQFAVLNNWAGLGGEGCYPDGDMLPLGKIGIRAERGQPRLTGFTKDEQYTLMTLFAIFRSPLMFGGDLPGNDKFTLSLLTNRDVLEVISTALMANSFSGIMILLPGQRTIGQKVTNTWPFLMHQIQLILWK